MTDYVLHAIYIAEKYTNPHPEWYSSSPDEVLSFNSKNNVCVSQYTVALKPLIPDLSLYNARYNNAFQHNFQPHHRHNFFGWYCNNNSTTEIILEELNVASILTMQQKFPSPHPLPSQTPFLYRHFPCITMVHSLNCLLHEYRSSVGYKL